MADETKDSKRTFRTIPGQKGRVKIILSRRSGEGGDAGPAPGSLDKTGGYLPPGYLPEDELVPSPVVGLRYLDMGTRFVEGPPHNYEEIIDQWAMEYSYAAWQTFRADRWASIQYSVPSNARPEYEAQILADDPFGFTTVEGRKVPNSLQLNHESAYGQAAVNFYVDGDGPYPASTEGEDPDWKWVAQHPDDTDWHSDVTEHELAPNTGQLVQRHKRNYTELDTDDPRYWYWDWWASYRFTQAPNFSAPAIDPKPKLRFPLRVFGAPALVYPIETVGAMAVQPSQPSSPPSIQFGFGFGYCTIQEWYVGYLMRPPQIPLPYAGSVEDWLGHQPMGLTVRRKARWARGVSNYYTPGNMPPQVYVPPTDIVWSVIPGRRPAPYEELAAQAMAQATADAPPPIGGMVAQAFENSIGLDWTKIAAIPGQLVGAVEIAGKLYYVWE